MDKLIEVARRAGCDALHPGYGFLAENPALARACADAGIAFIGPSPEAMEQLGSKTAARQLAHRAGVPMVPGVREPIEQFADAERAAQEIGYPVLLKAVAGGGGKGMRLVAAPAELSVRLARCRLGSPTTPLAIRACTSKNISIARGTSKFRSSATGTATSFIWVSANVPCSAAIRKSSKNRPRPS